MPTSLALVGLKGCWVVGAGVRAGTLPSQACQPAQQAWRCRWSRSPGTATPTAVHPCPPLHPAGDLFTALLLGWLHKRPGELKAALEAAVAGLQAVLRDTVDKCGAAAVAEERTAAVSSARELRLVQNIGAIAAPPLGQFAAEAID